MVHGGGNSARLAKSTRLPTCARVPYLTGNGANVKSHYYTIICKERELLYVRGTQIAPIQCCTSGFSFMPISHQRNKPYDINTERSRISTAHSKRLSVIQRKLARLDVLHPSAYGITIVKPEFGYWKIAVSQRLAGFEDTAAYRQFVTELEKYVNRQNPTTYVSRIPSVPTTSFKDIYNELQSKSSRDSLRKFLQMISKHHGYQLRIQGHKATLPLLFEEIEHLSTLPSNSGWFLN